MNYSTSYCLSIVTDFDPFGMITVGRDFGANYRFGFNGYENTDELLGENTAIDFGARIYDCRIARFFSIDPRSVEYPWQSVYVYYSNCPISIVDLLGMGGPGQDTPPAKSTQTIFTPGGECMAISGDANISWYANTIGNIYLTANENINKIGLKVANYSVLRFSVGGIEYTAAFNSGGHFTNYIDAQGNVYDPVAPVYNFTFDYSTSFTSLDFTGTAVGSASAGQQSIYVPYDVRFGFDAGERMYNNGTAVGAGNGVSATASFSAGTLNVNGYNANYASLASYLNLGNQETSISSGFSGNRGPITFGGAKTIGWVDAPVLDNDNYAFNNYFSIYDYNAYSISGGFGTPGSPGPDISIMISGSPNWYSKMTKADSIQKALWLYGKTNDKFYYNKSINLMK